MTSIDLYDELMKVPHRTPRTHLPIYNLTPPETQGSRKSARPQTNLNSRSKTANGSSSIYAITTTTSGILKTDSWITRAPTNRPVTAEVFRNLRAHQNKVRLKLLNYKRPTDQFDRHWKIGWEGQNRIPPITGDLLQNIQETTFGRRNRNNN
jgi:hypothetical protein